MKIVSLLLSLCLASVALAEEPAELVKLRKTWENSQAEAKKKAEEIYRSKNTKASKLYYDELYELKDNFMGAKNLQGAIAVDAEIKKLVETHRKMVVKVAEPQEKASPLDGAWLSYSNKKQEKYLRVFSKGFMAIGQEGGRILKWSLKNGIVVIDFGLPRRWEKLMIDPDNPAVMTGTNDAGSKVTYERVKW
jgi:hypothetical protein